MDIHYALLAEEFCFDLKYISWADIIEVFNSAPRYLGGVLNIDKPYFKGMVTRTAELLNCSWTKLILLILKPLFSTLHLSILNGFVSSNIYEFMTNAKTLILTLLLSNFSMATFLVFLLAVCTFLNLFGLHQCQVSCLITMLVTKLWRPNVSNSGIGITNVFF